MRSRREVALTRYVAIVGARNRLDVASVKSTVDALPADTTVVSGGAQGPDTWAEEAAIARGLAVLIFRPDLADTTTLGQRTRRYHARNQRIVDAADELVAFVKIGRTGGTEDTIRRAVRKGIPDSPGLAAPQRDVSDRWSRADRPNVAGPPTQRGRQDQCGCLRASPDLTLARVEGVGHIWIATGTIPVVTSYAETGVFDVVLNHNRYTLVDRSAEALMALCRLTARGSLGKQLGLGSLFTL